MCLNRRDHHVPSQAALICELRLAKPTFKFIIDGVVTVDGGKTFKLRHDSISKLELEVGGAKICTIYKMNLALFCILF